eukprot:TCONS_00047027-protein
MAYRFKVSKYKNANAQMPKKEQCISEIPIGRIMSSCGNFVTCSAKHIAFNIESGGGGCAGVLPLNYAGRRNTKVPTIFAHGEFLNDMCFSPYDDDLLVTCSYDGNVKLWDIPDDLEDIHDQPLSVITPDETTKKLEMINFHPLADEVLACSAFDAIHFLDLNSGETQTCVENGTQSLFQSMSWRWDGKVMVASSKDCINRIIDPRAGNVTSSFPGTQGNKDSRLVWLGNTDYILGSGFDKMRNRMVVIYDIRNPSSFVDDHEATSGSGVLMPFHDIDTNMVFLAGKGDQNIQLYEFDNAKLQFFSTASLQQQTFGMGLAPKRSLNVMQGEVNKVYQLSKNTITPIPYIVPRKSYRDFHADLFPDTVYSGRASMDAVEWFGGQSKEGITMSLNPQSSSKKVISSGLKTRKLSVRTDGQVKSTTQAPQVEASPKPSPAKIEETETKEIAQQPSEAPSETTKDAPKKKFKGLKGLKKAKAKEKTVEEKTEVIEKPEPSTGGFKAAYQSKYKHLLGKLMHKDNNIENITKLAENLPSESDAFQGSNDYLVYPISGVGGRLNVVQLSKPGRLPESDYPVIQNGCGIADFAMDPFDNQNIAVGCDDWKIRLWRIPKNGLSETLTEPTQTLVGHKQRVTIVRYHPTASNILVSASMDNTVRVWDLSDFSEIGALEGHTNQILCLAWHPDGKYMATFCKDKKIRVYNPVDDVEVLREGEGPDVLRGGRICWCGPNNNWLAISTSTGSNRFLHLYDSHTMEQLGEIEVDESPSVLSLYYDESSSVLFATGKGDRTIHSFEISEVEPKIHHLSIIKASGLLQGISLYQKNLLGIKNIEMARIVCLKKTNIELVSVTIPRVKPEFFQDDLFPDAQVTWEPAMTGEQWLDGNTTQPTKISLQPKGMKKLSEAPKEAPKAAKYSSQQILSAKSDEEKKAELINAMVGKLGLDDRLEQDDFEGVDEDEWDD